MQNFAFFWVRKQVPVSSKFFVAVWHHQDVTATCEKT